MGISIISVLEAGDLALEEESEFLATFFANGLVIIGVDGVVQSCVVVCEVSEDEVDAAVEEA